MTRRHEKYRRLIARCKETGAVPCAVAHPCDESSLRGAVVAGEMGLLRPVLVGPVARITELAAQCGLDISSLERVDAAHSVESAETAVRLAREGKVELLMKGSLHTDELMAAVVRRDSGLRTGRRISHCFIMDVPEIDRVVIITDAAVNIFPTLEDKVHIVQNAIDLAVALGLEQQVLLLARAEDAALSPQRIKTWDRSEEERLEPRRVVERHEHGDAVLRALGGLHELGALLLEKLREAGPEPVDHLH